MSPEMTAAINLIESLRDGDPVTVTFDGKAHDMVVAGKPHRADGQFGSAESTRVTVTYGPGGYSRPVIADHIVAGWVSIERRTVTA